MGKGERTEKAVGVAREDWLEQKLGWRTKRDGVMMKMHNVEKGEDDSAAFSGLDL